MRSLARSGDRSTLPTGTAPPSLPLFDEEKMVCTCLACRICKYFYIEIGSSLSRLSFSECGGGEWCQSTGVTEQSVIN